MNVAVQPAVRRSQTTIVYATSVALAAVLLFLVQPLFARIVLPALGGSPSVWTTSVLFFQVVLLAAYTYAHLLGRLRPARRAAILHLALVAIGVAWLPIDIEHARELAAGTPPAWRLVVAAVGALGLPVFTVAATAPLLQRWLSVADPARGQRTYAMYAASNAGSLGGLLAYPLLVERWFTLTAQARIWQIGYLLLIGCLAGAVSFVWRVHERPTPVPELDDAVEASRDGAPPGWPARAGWLLRAAIAASLMQSVTTYITTDIAAAPLLWVLPLSAYLLTFVIAFAPRPMVPERALAGLVPVTGLLVLLALLTNLTRPAWVLLLVHLTGVFVLALGCHVALAAAKPRPRYLTGFYLWLALGGALGSVVNVLVAPHVFTSPIEYPLGIIAACLVRPLAHWSWDRRDLRRDLAWAALAIFLGLASRVGLQRVGFESASFGVLLATVALPVLVATLHWPHARRFALMLAAVFACAPPMNDLHVVHASRNFFGVLRVAVSGNGRFTEFFHGSTLHGAQSRQPGQRREPLTYFRRKGPVGQVFATLEPSLDRASIAVVGLGAGTLATYAEAGQHWTFYEIDPDVVTIASDTHYFSYLAAARSPVRVVVDDGRLAVGREPPGTFAVIVLDAFSSDAIPVHLLTTEALRLYTRTLRPGGVLLMNVSNRYLDLASVVAASARAAGLQGLVQFDALTDAERRTRVADSTWILIGSRADALRPFTADARWHALRAPANVRAWTDDFSNLYGAVMWRR
jgi:hypothetical protein